MSLIKLNWIEVDVCSRSKLVMKDNFQLIWLICFLPFVQRVWSGEKKNLKISKEFSGDCWLACEKHIIKSAVHEKNYSISIWRANKKLHPEIIEETKKNHIKKAIFLWITCVCISVHTHTHTHLRTHKRKEKKNQTDPFLFHFIHWLLFGLVWHGIYLFLKIWCPFCYYPSSRSTANISVVTLVMNKGTAN